MYFLGDVLFSSQGRRNALRLTKHAGMQSWPSFKVPGQACEVLETRLSPLCRGMDGKRLIGELEQKRPPTSTRWRFWRCSHEADALPNGAMRSLLGSEIRPASTRPDLDGMHTIIHWRSTRHAIWISVPNAYIATTFVFESVTPSADNHPAYNSARGAGFLGWTTTTTTKLTTIRAHAIKLTSTMVSRAAGNLPDMTYFWLW